MSGRRRLAAFLAVLLILSLPAPAVYAMQEETWTCPNGHEGNTGNFCTECGTPKPEEESAAEWTCPRCGSENSGKFCPECGMSREDAEAMSASEWTCPNGHEGNTGNFCTVCGAAKEDAGENDASDSQPAPGVVVEAEAGTEADSTPDEQEADAGTEDETPAEEQDAGAGTEDEAAPEDAQESAAAEEEPIFTNEDQLEYLRAPYDRTLNVMRAESGVYWVRDDQSEKDFIYDVNGNTLYEGDRLEDVRTFDHYLLTDNHLFLDYAGNQVFDLAEEGFEYKDVLSFEALDADLLLVSEYINTFSETATYYYSLNIRTGEKIRLDEGYIPRETGHRTSWFYLGSGYFLNACPHSGFGGEHHMLNLADGSVYLCYDEATGETKLPDYYFWNNLCIGDKALYYCEGENICILNGETGGIVKTPILQSGAGGYVISGAAGGVELTPSSQAEAGGTDSFVRVVSEGHSGTDFIYQCTGYDQAENATPCLLDLRTRVLTPVGIFSSYKIFQHDEEGNYLLHVTNAGGGQFISVINGNGDLIFEPFPYTSLRGSNRNYFAVNDEDQMTHLYNWSGEEIFSCDSNGELWFGEHSVIFRNDETPRTLLKEDGTLQVLEEDFFGREKASEEEYISGIGYRFRNYDFNQLYVSEDGEYRRFIVPAEETASDEAASDETAAEEAVF